MKCSGCLQTIKEGNSIKCTSPNCEKNFCSLCINPTSLTTDRKKTWKCPDCCATQKKGGDNSQTPIRSGADSNNVTMRRKIDSSTDCPDSEMKELANVITRLTAEFSLLKNKLEEVTCSLSHCHERMDEIVHTLSNNNSRLANLEKRDSEVVTLRAMVTHLQEEVNEQEQFNLRNELEIVGIPENSNENLGHIVKVAAQKVRVHLIDEDVDWITRIGARRPPVTSSLPDGSGRRMSRPVVVRLLRRSKRDQIIKASKSRKNLTSADLEITGAPVGLFFNERLTKNNRLLFRETRIRAKIQGYAFCWCNQGAIYIRQREGKSAQRIRSHQDLDRLLPPALGTNIS